MSVKEAPLAKVKRLHGSKEKLVDTIIGMLSKAGGSDESEAELRVRLVAAANKKLLRLHESLTQMNEKYGSKEELVEALTKAQGRTKDSDYKDSLHGNSIHKLLDMTRAAARVSRR
ncbi:MAG: hypothetical protein AAGC55_01250 [Myxococcota bacterium]